MSSSSNDDTLTQNLQFRQEERMATTNPDKTIQLTATASGNVITINGNGSDSLATDSGSCKFKFELNDNGLGVSFASLDTADGLTGCPPSGNGNKSSQIEDVDIDPSKPLKASFKDKNDNDATKGALNVCYQWNFACSDTTKTVRPFDPIISNGGKN